MTKQFILIFISLLSGAQRFLNPCSVSNIYREEISRAYRNGWQENFAYIIYTFYSPTYYPYKNSWSRRISMRLPVPILRVQGEFWNDQSNLWIIEANRCRNIILSDYCFMIMWHYIYVYQARGFEGRFHCSSVWPRRDSHYLVKNRCFVADMGVLHLVRMFSDYMPLFQNAQCY